MKSALKWLGNSEQLIFATNQLLDDLSINTKLAAKNEEKIKESMMYLRKLEIESFARSFLQGVKFTNSKLERFLSLVHKIIDTFDDICVDVFENVSQYLLPFLYSIKICLEELSKGEVLKVISTFLSSLTYSIKELDNLFKMVESKEFNLTTLFKQLNKTFQGSEQVTNFEPFQQFQILAQQQEWIHSFELLLESFKVHPDKIHFFRTVLINTLELVSEEKAITRIQQFLKPMLPKQQTIDLAFKNLIDCLNPVNHLFALEFLSWP
ncbi:hypothetical protein M0812_06746 [Anaeramoeba flamelloides]|uniref:Uncharacterized protein n=1 Tax=Anaeramoeba flamelloides TaxID=1746091 RepID=A0AAV8A8F6_9EUKA|nr:hypothetical protein M0812_06746 [Anaeramoeba flamelloides]